MGSRYIYSIAMKNKTDTEVLKALKKIYTQSKIRPFAQTMEANL